MTRNAQDIINEMRNIVKPTIAEMLLEANFEGCGKEDKAEFETEFEMILTLAEKALERWIPVSERLPESDVDVLTQYSDYSMSVDFRTASSSGWFWADEDLPIAWMPLPQPYTESEDKE